MYLIVQGIGLDAIFTSVVQQLSAWESSILLNSLLLILSQLNS